MTAGPVNRGANGCRWACDRLEVGGRSRPGAPSHRCHHQLTSASHLFFFQAPAVGDRKRCLGEGGLFRVEPHWHVTQCGRLRSQKNAFSRVTYHVCVIALNAFPCPLDWPRSPFETIPMARLCQEVAWMGGAQSVRVASYQKVTGSIPGKPKCPWERQCARDEHRRGRRQPSP